MYHRLSLSDLFFLPVKARGIRGPGSHPSTTCGFDPSCGRKCYTNSALLWEQRLAHLLLTAPSSHCGSQLQVRGTPKHRGACVSRGRSPPDPGRSFQSAKGALRRTEMPQPVSLTSDLSPHLLGHLPSQSLTLLFDSGPACRYKCKHSRCVIISPILQMWITGAVCLPDLG